MSTNEKKVVTACSCNGATHAPDCRAQKPKGVEKKCGCIIFDDAVVYCPKHRPSALPDKEVKERDFIGGIEVGVYKPPEKGMGGKSGIEVLREAVDNKVFDAPLDTGKEVSTKSGDSLLSESECKLSCKEDWRPELLGITGFVLLGTRPYSDIPLFVDKLLLSERKRIVEVLEGMKKEERGHWEVKDDLKLTEVHFYNSALDDAKREVMGDQVNEISK